jgi:two-component system, OmpR family, sensor histidine kinase KdpD
VLASTRTIWPQEDAGAEMTLMRSGSTLWFRPLVHDFLVNVLLVAATTVIIYAAATLLDVHYLVALYLIPIVFAMLRSGFAQSLVVVVLSALAVSFFFYEPVYSFYVADPEELVELVIFAVLTVVIAYLVTVLRDLRHMGPDQLR